MGITQFSQGVETVKCCCSLAMLTGNFGHYACGTAPVRGQNNVQGTCDMGDLPNVYPGYQSVTDPKVQAKFEKAWGVKLDNKIGIQLTRIAELSDQKAAWAEVNKTLQNIRSNMRIEDAAKMGVSA
ncbi:MAG: hypothetical protein Ta2G_14400 [Termitinemataceae bacterium]|nr:MAG: hypothetical protein Ta2G_14400 [Termitinemataceae bacterium]